MCKNKTYFYWRNCDVTYGILCFAERRKNIKFVNYDKESK